MESKKENVMMKMVLVREVKKENMKRPFYLNFALQVSCQSIYPFIIRRELCGLLPILEPIFQIPSLINNSLPTLGALSTFPNYYLRLGFLF